MEIRIFRSDSKVLSSTALAVALAISGLSGCQTSEVFHNGYVVDQAALDLVPVGSSREQVLLSLGTPSTTATFEGEVFYYISQKRTRSVAFMKQKLVEQQILAIYFDKDGIVTQLANYTLQDGKVFDSISRLRGLVDLLDLGVGGFDRHRQLHDRLREQLDGLLLILRLGGAKCEVSCG